MKGRHRGCALGRKKGRHSARAQDERGVSIWAESRKRWGELLRSGAEAEFVTESVNLCDQLKLNDSCGVIYGRNVTWTGKGSLRYNYILRPKV